MKLSRFIVAGLIVCGLILRVWGLGDKSYWGDEGNTVLSVEGIREEGIPRFPSGAIYYKSLLVSYLSAIFSVPLGVNEMSMRLPFALLGTACIPALYLFAKCLFGEAVGLGAAAILTFSHWEVELSRNARYYSGLQFVYILGLMFIFRGLIREEKKLRILAVITIALSPLFHKLGLAVAVAYLPAIILCGGTRFVFGDLRDTFQKLWQKGKEATPDTGFLKHLRFTAVQSFSLQAFIVVLSVAGWQFFESLFWDVGFVEAPTGEGLSRSTETLFKNWTPSFFHMFSKSYPVGSFLVWWLVPLLSLNVIADGVNPGGNNSRESLKLSFEASSFYAYSILILTVFALGFGRAHAQPRYLFFLHPVFIALTTIAIYRISGLLVLCLGAIIPPASTRKVKIVIFIVLLFLISEHSNPREAWNISHRKPGDTIDSRFTHSTAANFVDDLKSPNIYLLERLQKADVLITTGLLPQYAYSHRIDYWLWTAEPWVWDAFTEKDGKVIDRYIGVPLIRNLSALNAILEANKDRRVWIVTNTSAFRDGNLSWDVSAFLESNLKNSVYTSPDGGSRVYLWEPGEK